MEPFIKFLESSKERLKNFKTCSNIHIVLGNESCDLDSTVSALLMAYLLYKKKGILNMHENVLVLPIMNLEEKYFRLRTETCYVLKECGISTDLLIFRNHVNFEEIVKQRHVTTSLVDHHIMSPQDVILKNTVVQVYDHRPFDPASQWHKDKIRLQIKQVGSCTSLVANEVLRMDVKLLCKELAVLIYDTVVYDTIALVPENGKAKELDLMIARTMEEMFDLTEGRQAVFDRLWSMHNDVTHLTPGELLLKDLKVVEGIPIPGLPMLVEEYLNIEGAYEAIDAFCDEYKLRNVVLLIGINATKELKRDIGIYWKPNGNNLKIIMLNKLINCERKRGYSFCFSETVTTFKDIVCYRQNNTKLSRKQMVPVILDAVGCI